MEGQSLQAPRSAKFTRPGSFSGVNLHLTLLKGMEILASQLHSPAVGPAWSQSTHPHPLSPATMSYIIVPLKTAGKESLGKGCGGDGAAAAPALPVPSALQGLVIRAHRAPTPIHIFCLKVGQQVGGTD